MQLAYLVADWLTVLRAAPHLEFTRVVSWDGQRLWFCEFEVCGGRRVRDVVIDGERVWTKEECDV